MSSMKGVDNNGYVSGPGEDVNSTNEKAKYDGSEIVFEEDKGTCYWRSTTCRILSVIILVFLVACVTVTAVCLSGLCSPTPCSLDCGASSVHWGYLDSNGPVCWGGCYDLCDSGKTQSPIDILSGQAVTGTIPALVKSGYDVENGMTLLNNGHAVQVDLPDQTYTISGLGLGATYTAAQFHVHWGTDSSKGSEHVLNGAASPMEVHFVHYNSDLYGSLGEAADKPNGLAVLGFFYQISPTDNPSYDPIVSKLPDIEYAKTNTALQEIILDNLLPVAWQDGNLYRYNGSLTTPACHESVIWSVFTDYISISESQLNAFRTTIMSGEADDPDNHALEDSFRPPQPLGTRQIQFYSQL